MNTYREYRLGDMLARYVTDEQGHIGLMLLPASRAADRLDKKWAVVLLPRARSHAISISLFAHSVIIILPPYPFL